MKLKVLNNSNTRSNLWQGAMEDVYSFTIVAPPNKNGEISKVLMYPDYCRDSLIANIFSGMAYRKNAGILPALKGDRGHSYLMFVYKYNYTDIDDNTGKVFPRASKQTNVKLKTSVGVLNKIEAEAKWPKSHLIFPTHDWQDKLNLAVFKVTHNWFYSPYMFSMLVLILRAVLYTNIYKLDKVPEVRKLRTYFRERRDNWVWSECSETKNYAARTMRYWVSVLKNFKAIHKGTDWEYNFNSSSYNQGLTNCHLEGILTLVDGRSSNGIISHNYDEVFGEE